MSAVRLVQKYKLLLKYLLRFSLFSVLLWSEIDCGSLKTRSLSIGKLTREEKILQKNQLVADFNNLKTSLTEAVGRGDPQEIQSLVNQLNDNIWPTLVDVSLDLIGTDVCVWEDEEQFQRQLRHTMAHLLYLAGDRRCESPDETYFMNKCVRTGDNEAYCPKTTSLYDGPGNIGYCDCLYSKGTIYSPTTGLCYLPKTRGPCKDGEWFVFNADSKTSECELVPDGQHIISISNERNLEKAVDKLFCEEDRGVFKTAPFFQMRRCPKVPSDFIGA